MRVPLRPMLGAILASVVTGCASIGPTTIKQDRTDYSGAMASSWKEQMLLNIVKFRYFDLPVFVDVSSVISSPQLQAQANVAAALFGPAANLPKTGSSGGSSGSGGSGQAGVASVGGTYVDHPTISYTPITGDRFINALLRPIPPQIIFGMIDAGHDAQFLLSLTVRSINGVNNYSLSPGHAQQADPRFRSLTAAIRRIQRAGAINTRTARTGKLSKTLVIFRHKARGSVEQDIRLVKRMLGLAPVRNEFILTGEPSHKPDEIAVRTRSMQEIMTELAAGVDVPKDDIGAGRATEVAASNGMQAAPLIRIHFSSEAPVNAYASVQYRNGWFWVSDTDLSSKRVFIFLMLFSALSETRAVPQLPIVTIPTN